MFKIDYQSSNNGEVQRMYNDNFREQAIREYEMGKLKEQPPTTLAKIEDPPKVLSPKDQKPPENKNLQVPKPASPTAVSSKSKAISTNKIKPA